MKWTKISVYSCIENEETLSNFLAEISNGLSIDYSMQVMKEDIDDFHEKFRLNEADYPSTDIRLSVYYDETQNYEQKINEIQTFIKKNPTLKQPENIEIVAETVKEADWENEWKKYFHSFRVSDSFMIVPSWELSKYEHDSTDHLIKLDPGMAFGTGDHPSTSMCLQFIEKIVKNTDQIIDVGTGSGILTIGSYLMGAKKLTATDIDELSLKVARENFELNDTKHVNLYKSDLLKNETGKYDIVIANILAHIIEMMIADAYRVLNSNGYFISSGIITEKKEQIVSQLKSVGFKIEEVLEDSGWVSILAKKEE